jgi:SAM-dependent methyltransferase
VSVHYVNEAEATGAYMPSLLGRRQDHRGRAAVAAELALPFLRPRARHPCRAPCLAPELDGKEMGFNPRMFATLARIEDGHFWFEGRNELIAWLARRYAPRARRVLEIGCGTGFVLQALRASCPSASIVGSELHSAGLAVARGRHDGVVELIQADARRLCVRDALDVVCALDVLEHIEEDEQVLKGIEAALPWRFSDCCRAAASVALERKRRS